MTRASIPRIGRVFVAVFTCFLALALTTMPVNGRASGGVQAAPDPAIPGFLTLQFGRTQWVGAASCAPMSNTVPLDVVATELKARQLSATGTIVLNRTAETVRKCIKGSQLSASWLDVSSLRDNYGWTFVSAGWDYQYMTLLTPQQQWDESCGSLPEFVRRGHLRAHGLFAYPNDKSTVQIQQDVVSTCFAYGRKYGTTRTLMPTSAPHFQFTRSANGGKCNDSSLPCYSTGASTRYVSPIALGNLAAAGPGQWTSIQWYRFVTGTRQGGTGGAQWDCRSSDWRRHWTSGSEVYCYDDFLAVLDAIPDTVTVTDPLTVAQAWGRA